MTFRMAMAAAALALSATAAHSVTLFTGSGEGDVTVGVDGFGAFGSAVGGDGTGNAFYNPVGPIGEAGTTFQSGVAIDVGGIQPILSTGNIGGSLDGLGIDDPIIVAQTATYVESTFMVNNLDVFLTQSVSPVSDSSSNRTGAILNQVYQITNTADAPVSFDVVRYIDGDLFFDGSISDGGGRIFEQGNEILFETDSASGDDESTTFLGITGIGGTIPATNRFQISSFSGLRTNVINNIPLGDFIQRDIDNDGFIDEPFDVTLALRNEFSLGVNQSATYTTQTLFGNAVPPSPGSLEALPLLPADIDPDGAFVFDINADDINPGETIFIDPDIAVGYVYTIEGGTFTAVQVPSLASVNDPDGYFLTVGDSTQAIAPGQLVFLPDGTVMFEITGIDPALMLDPTDIVGFVTGIRIDPIESIVTIRQDPLVEQIGMAPVPLPAGVLLLGTALVGLGGAVRLGRRG